MMVCPRCERVLRWKPNGLPAHYAPAAPKAVRVWCRA